MIYVIRYKLLTREGNGSDGPGESGYTEKKSSAEPNMIYFNIQVLGLLLYLKASC